MRNLTSLDLRYIVRELEQVVGAKLEKAYQHDEDRTEFLLSLHKSGVGKRYLRIKLPGLIHLSETKPDFPDKPLGFAMFLRKHLGQARIESVRQHGFERIIEIVWSTKAGSKKLIIELFSQGNIVLCDQERIIGILSSQTWQARTLRAGNTYAYPPQQTNTPSLTKEEFDQIIASSELDSPVKTLAIKLGLGGYYAELVMQRGASYQALQSVLDDKSGACIADGQAYPLHVGGERRESFSSALEETSPYELSQKEEKQAKVKVDKTKLVVEKQKERAAELAKSIKENERKAELLYERYIEVRQALEEFNNDRKKLTWLELEKKYKDHPLIRSIDKKGKLVLEL